jgi:hypothetical protein
MKKKHKREIDYLELSLILIAVILIAFILWFVRHSRSQAVKSLDNAADSSQLVTGTKKKTENSSQPALHVKKKSIAKPSDAVVSYTSGDNGDGIEISGDTDVDKLDGASDSFKDFIKQKIDSNGHRPSPCGNAYGLFVKQIYKDDFAVGSEKQCGDTQKLWAKISGAWTEIGASQDAFDCSTWEQYNVPSAIVSQCIKNGQIVDNSQQ